MGVIMMVDTNPVFSETRVGGPHTHTALDVENGKIFDLRNASDSPAVETEGV